MFLKALEGNDDKYAWNACRVPWRLGSHFVVSGDARAQSALNRISNWIKSATNGNPSNIVSGYLLSGSEFGSWDSMAFAAPFGVGAMVDASHQSWLNSIWTEVASYHDQGYFEDSIKVISMIVMSGNWWAPEALPDPCAP